MNRLIDFAAVSVLVIPLVIIFFKMMYNFGVLLFAKKVLPTLHSYVIPRRLCIPTISWKSFGVVVKHPREMSFKCRRSVGSALCQNMRTPKLYVILKKIITKRMTYTQTTTKSISLSNAHERLKSAPPLFTVHFLLVTRSQCFRFWI